MSFTKFSEIEYKRPNFDEIKSNIKTYIENFKKAKSFDEAKKLFLDYQKSGEELSTMFEVAMIRNTIDTTDEYYETEVNFFNENMPQIEPLEKEADELILSSQYKDEFSSEFGSIFIKNMEIGQKLVSEEIISDKVEEAKLSQEYSKVTAQAKCDFDGEECNFYGLLKHLESVDRDERIRAYNAWADMYASIALKLDEIYSKLVKVRDSMAKKLGFDSYIDYIYLANGRYDYTAKDIAKFRENVRKYITPAVAKLFEEQRKAIGVDKLHYYDEQLTSPEGNANPEGTMEEMVAKAKEMYSEMNAQTGEFFNFMCEHELFDLESKPGKHMGGYCTFLPFYKAPFIFSNFNGTSADVDVLTHEAGHAFQAFSSCKLVPLLNMTWSTSEISEIHSMSMEFFTYPWMDKFFKDPDKYRKSHLADALKVIPYMVSVDEFQHRVFEKPDMTADERYATWREIEKKYMPWRDYDGNEFLEKGGFWLQKQHIFMYPFYYIEYALAQTCTFQYYARMKNSRAEAWEDYYRLCCAGGSRGYLELLKIGNLKVPFDEEVIKNVTEVVMNDLL